MHFVGDLKVSDSLSIVSSILQLIFYSPEASLLLLGSAPVWLPVSWLMWEAQCWGCVFVIPKTLMRKMLMGQVAMVAVFFRKSNLLVNHRTVNTHSCLPVFYLCSRPPFITLQFQPPGLIRQGISQLNTSYHSCTKFKRIKIRSKILY